MWSHRRQKWVESPGPCSGTFVDSLHFHLELCVQDRSVCVWCSLGFYNTHTHTHTEWDQRGRRLWQVSTCPPVHQSAVVFNVNLSHLMSNTAENSKNKTTFPQKRKFRFFFFSRTGWGVDSVREIATKTSNRLWVMGKTWSAILVKSTTVYNTIWFSRRRDI